MTDDRLTADTMDTDGALRLLSTIFETIRKDYISGKVLLLKLYGRDMPEEEYTKQWNNDGSTSTYIRRYYAAIRSVNRDYYGIGEIISPTLIFDTWDKEVMSHLTKQERRRVEYSEQIRGDLYHGNRQGETDN